MYTAIVARPIDAAALLAAVAAPGNGAAVLFVGTVRDAHAARAVTGLEYAAYRPMAERELGCIASEAAARHGTHAIAVEHRVGQLAVGEASVAIAVAHPHRDAAFAASREIIEEIKRRLPVWKREGYADGSRAWVGLTEGSAR